MRIKLFVILFSFIGLSQAYGQLNYKDYVEAEIIFYGLFGHESSIDEYGNVVLDMGSASTGRVKFRLSDVSIRMEERKEQPGCSDMCPPMIIIHFECLKSNCVTDPAIATEPSKTGTISMTHLKRGKIAFEFLKSLQVFLYK